MRKRFSRFVQDGSRGDDGLEGENPERARECIFARKRFPATLSGICGEDDELERADSERARKQIRMRKGFPSSPRGKKKRASTRKRRDPKPRGDDGNRTRVISLED